MSQNGIPQDGWKGALSRREFLGVGAGALAVFPMLASRATRPTQAKSRLILLGTAGGPTPKPNRAAPSQVIVVNGASYVIDCGNGVARQMILARLRLGSIRGVFLTHQHSDHNADLGNLILLAWASDLTEQVRMFGPPPLSEMMRRFLSLNEADIRTRTADEGRPRLDRLISAREVRKGGLVMQDGNVKVTAAVVNHPPVTPSFAYRFDCPDRSIVISGDTAPSDELIRLARGADVLVHEVMHVPSIETLIAGETNARTLREHLLASHTTTDQVGRVATEAGVKTLVLSHFVPGGAPFLSDEAWLDAVRPHYSGRIIVGRDLLEI
ncbi:MAG TPA: MBL fold metallo-hydrolase [Gemmatimonadaceae bacterium]|nr:MBL fold metallo-hydrolase [Gemmatimonadaceae bacterium]